MTGSQMKPTRDLDTLTADTAFLRSLDAGELERFRRTFRLTAGQMQLLERDGKTWITPRQGREAP